MIYKIFHERLYYADVNASCTNFIGSFRCECSYGYERDGLICADIDEYAIETENCFANDSCSDGVLSCSCNAGFSGDGVDCNDVDECAQGIDNCDADASC